MRFSKQCQTTTRYLFAYFYGAFDLNHDRITKQHFKNRKQKHQQQKTIYTDTKQKLYRYTTHETQKIMEKELSKELSSFLNKNCYWLECRNELAILKIYFKKT